MQLNENLLIEQRANQYGSIFRKIDIYNARKRVLNENQYNDIRFTLTEQEAIKEMFQIMAYKILENNLPGELNEGFWDSIKQGAQNIKDKVNAGVEKLQQLPEKAKKAYEFCQQIIQKSVSKVSELIRYIAELFAKLADKVRDAIMMLGGFGINEITEAEDSFSQYPDDEKQFLSAVFEYTQQKKGDNRLTEGWLDKFEEKVSQNKFLEIILVGKYKGQKLSWWKSLLVSLVGSIVINLGVGFICAGVGIAAPTAAAITSVILLIWSMRGALKVILNRKSQMKQTGETKFWNKATIIQLIIIIGVTAFFQIPAVKEWMGEVINAGVNKSADWVKDKFGDLMELVGKNPTTEQVQAILEDRGTSATAAAETFSEETTKSVKDQIEEWMKGKAATGMAKLAGENLQVDAPGCDVYVISANTNLTNAMKVLEPALEKLGGEVQTAVSSNEWGKTYLLNVVLPEGTDIGSLPQDTINALKDAGADVARFVKLDNIGNIITPEPVQVASVDSEILNPGAYFGGIAASPIFSGLKGNIKLSLGSEARKNQYVTVTNFKDMTFGEAQDALKVLGENANNLGFRRLKAQDKMSKGFTAKLSMISDSKLEEAEGQDNDNKLKDAIETNADPKNDKCLVFFTNVKSEGKIKELPLVAINYRTLYAVDLIKSKKLKARKNPYFVKGLFNHLTIKPVKDGDVDTQNEIKKFLMSYLWKSVSGLAKLCQATIGEVKHIGKKNEWIPKAEDNDKNRLELGNFTTAEFCDILNNPKESYKYFGGGYATDITKTDEHGNVLKAKNNHIKIEDKKNYVQEKLYPIISNKATDVYKELYDNELIRKAFFNDKGEFKKVRQGDKNIPVVLHPTISVALFRSPDNFNTEQKKTIGEYIMQKLGKSEKADGKDFARATQLLSSITWKYAGDREAWAKQVKQAKNNTTNESISVNLKENKMYAETVKLTQKYNTNLSESARKLGYNKDYIKLTEDWINKNGLN